VYGAGTGAADGVVGTGGLTSGNGGTFAALAGNGDGAKGTGNGTGAGVHGIAATGTAGHGVKGEADNTGSAVFGHHTGAGTAGNFANASTGLAGNFDTSAGSNYGVVVTGNTTKSSLRLIDQATQPATADYGAIWINPVDGTPYVWANHSAVIGWHAVTIT
jgi:hypothetical protein